MSTQRCREKGGRTSFHHSTNWVRLRFTQHVSCSLGPAILLSRTDIKALLLMIAASIVAGLVILFLQQRVSNSPPVTMEAINNLTYVVRGDHISLTHGKLDFGTSVSTAGYTKAWITNVSFGDIDRDTDLDAAVILSVDYGGSATFSYLIPVINEEGVAAATDSHVELGSNIEVRRLTIMNRSISVQLLTHGVDDPHCCPSELVEQEYEYRDEELLLLNGKVGLSARSSGHPKLSPILRYGVAHEVLDRLISLDCPIQRIMRMRKLQGVVPRMN